MAQRGAWLGAPKRPSLPASAKLGGFRALFSPILLGPVGCQFVPELRSHETRAADPEKELWLPVFRGGSPGGGGHRAQAALPTPCVALVQPVRQAFPVR